MNLQNHIQRCQGRSMRTPLGETLAEECTDCARRICIEPDQNYSWMEPPKVHWWHGRICGSWLPDREDLVDVVVGMREPGNWLVGAAAEWPSLDDSVLPWERYDESN